MGPGNRRGLGNYLRMRGEYDIFRALATGATELPPHARRIQETGRPPRRSIGTTSACAENTRPAGLLRLDHRNYLRMRGEY